MKRLCTFFLAIQAIYSYAQPAKTTLQGKEFYVYPLRSNEAEIPPYFVPIPDGNYIMYNEYTFKKVRFKKEMKLEDTTVVRAVFSIKNNVVWGKASFYSPNKFTQKTGEYVNGLPEGVWEEHQEHVYKKLKWKVTDRITYKAGLKEGEYTQLNDGSIVEKGQYKNNSPTGTWYNMSSDGKIWHQYTYADSVTWVRGVYDYMYPNRGSNKHYHGTEIENLAHIEKIEHAYGQVVFFDTLFYWSGEPEYILTKKEKNMPDSIALFVLTQYFTTGKLKLVREYRAGNTISTHYYRDDKDGKEYETSYTSDFYKLLKTGDLFLKRAYYGPENTRYEYTMNGFSKSFERHIAPNGDTLTDFKIFDIDTNRFTYSFERFTYEPVTKVKNVRYGHLYVDTNTTVYAYNRFYEVTDSSLMFQNNVPFTGVVKGIYHKRKSKHRVAHEKTGLVIYANRKYYSYDFPYTYNTYTEMRNGKPHGKMISESRSSVTIEYKKNGLNHGTDITTTYNVKLTKEMREIARKNGITSKKVTYISARSEYNNGERTGHWENRNAAGVVTDSRNFVNDKMQGERIEKFYDGSVREISNSEQGMRHGKHVRKDISGTTLEESEYANDMLNGYLKKYKSTGEPDFSIYAQNNILDGQAILYNEIGLMEWKLEFNAADSVPHYYVDASEVNSYRERFAWDSDNLVKTLQNRLKPYPASFIYTEYFYTGKVAAEGVFKDGRMTGTWKFYDLDGNRIHEVDFKTEEINLPHDTLFVMGKITSYYTNGKIQSTGYLENFERNYDCKSKKNVYNFSIIFENYWEMDGKQTLVNGNGQFTQYDEHGQRLASGEYFEYQQNGFWKWWDKDAKLNTAGHFVEGSREGTWWYGDLEGLSFIDNACFDTSSDEVIKQISEMKKNLYIRQSIYLKDVEMSSHEFDMNMNKERKYRKYNPIYDYGF